MVEVCAALESSVLAEAGALRDPDRDPAGRARGRRHRAARPHDPRRAPGVAPACTTAPTTTARRSGSRPPTSRWSTRWPTTPRRSCRWPRPAPASRSATARPTSCRSARATTSGRRGRCTRGWSGARSSAASTRAGTCTRRSCRRGSRRRSRSTPTAPAIAAARLRAYLDRRESGVLDEPATARALAGFLQRGLDCGALDPAHPDLSALRSVLPRPGADDAAAPDELSALRSALTPGSADNSR